MTPDEKKQILIANGWEPVQEGVHQLWLDPDDETRNDPTTFKNAYYAFRQRRYQEKVAKQKKEMEGLTLNR